MSDGPATHSWKTFCIAKNTETKPRNTDGTKRQRQWQRKRTWIIGTWNIQGIRNKTEDVVREVEKRGMDLCVLSETKKKGQGTLNINKYIHLYSGVNKEEHAKRGVSMLILKKYKKYISNWQAINERILKVNLNLKGSRITIIGTYGPNDDARVEEKTEYYELLEEIISQIGQTREVIILGDLNARTGTRTNDKIIGPYGENTTNENGNRLIEMCRQNSLRILNGYFKHKEIHTYTWTQPTRNLRSVIDYLIMKQKSKIKVQDVRVFRGAECGSDHHLLKAKILLPLTGKCRHQQNHNGNLVEVEQLQYNLASLDNESTRELYKKRLDQQLPLEYKQETTEDLHRVIIKGIHQAAKEALGTKESRPRKRNVWWNDQLQEIKEHKQKLYQRWLGTKELEHKREYREMVNKFKAMVIEAKNQSWERKCQELDTYIGGRKSRESWRMIKSMRSNKIEQVAIDPIEPENWEKHYKTLLAEQRPEYKNITPHEIRVQGEPVTISIEETKKAILLLKNGRAPGPEGVYAELIKNGTNKLLEILTEVFNRHLRGEPIPQSWREGWITSIHKKGSKTDCNNYRGITVTSTLSRLYGRIIKERICEEYRPFESEEQNGFRAGRSTIDSMFCLSQVIEKRTLRSREVHLLLVDLTKAYDTVPVAKLWEVLEKTSINVTLINAVKDIYKDIVSKVKIGNKISNGFKVTKGLKQGCCLSPVLFNIYIDEALRQWKKKCNGMGLTIGDTTLYTLHYADDQVVIARDKEDLEYMGKKLLEEYKKWGLEVNLNKTQYLCIGGGKHSEDLDLEVGKIKKYDQCIYLGMKLTETGRSDEAVKDRITKGKQVVGTLNSVLWEKNIRPETKKKIYNTILKPVVIYGSEVWQLTQKIKNNLLAVEMDFWRRSARKSRVEHVKNEDIRRQMKVSGSIIEDIEKQQLVWYGHVRRMGPERLPRQVLEWIPPERRKRGRPPATWIQGISKAMSARNLSEDDWQNRQAWRTGTQRRITL